MINSSTQAQVANVDTTVFLHPHLYYEAEAGIEFDQFLILNDSTKFLRVKKRNNIYFYSLDKNNNIKNELKIRKKDEYTLLLPILESHLLSLDISSLSSNKMDYEIIKIEDNYSIMEIKSSKLEIDFFPKNLYTKKHKLEIISYLSDSDNVFLLFRIVSHENKRSESNYSLVKLKLIDNSLQFNVLLELSNLLKEKVQLTAIGFNKLIKIPNSNKILLTTIKEGIELNSEDLEFQGNFKGINTDYYIQIIDNFDHHYALADKLVWDSNTNAWKKVERGIWNYRSSTFTKYISLPIKLEFNDKDKYLYPYTLKDFNLYYKAMDKDKRYGLMNMILGIGLYSNSIYKVNLLKMK